MAVEAFGPDVRDYSMDSRQRLMVSSYHMNKLADLTFNQEMRDRLS